METLKYMHGRNTASTQSLFVCLMLSAAFRGDGKTAAFEIT